MCVHSIQIQVAQKGSSHLVVFYDLQGKVSNVAHRFPYKWQNNFRVV